MGRLAAASPFRHPGLEPGSTFLSGGQKGGQQTDRKLHASEGECRFTGGSSVSLSQDQPHEQGRNRDNGGRQQRANVSLAVNALIHTER